MATGYWGACSIMYWQMFITTVKHNLINKIELMNMNPNAPNIRGLPKNT